MNRLIIFTSLPKVGGHSTLTLGLCRMLRPHFSEIEVWCKVMPEHGHSEELARELEAMGCTITMLSDLHGKIHFFTTLKAVQEARSHRRETVFFTLAMRHLSVVLALLTGAARSVYFHITHDLNISTIRRLTTYTRVFTKLVFICPATYREFPNATSNPNITWVPQSSEIPVLDIDEIRIAKKLQSSPKGTFRLGLLGRLTKEKGALAMLEFMKSTRQPCELHVAGAGPYAEDFIRAAEGFQPPLGKVIFHGSYDPATREIFLRRFFSTIDLLVVPSQDMWETLSMVTLEALQHGTPSVLCATGGLISFGLPELGPAPTEVITLVPPERLHETLEARIQSEAFDTDLHVTQCRAYYAEHFRDAQVIGRWLDVLGASSPTP